jgi:hypothetical protein
VNGHAAALHRLAALSMVGAAVLAVAGFAALGSIFDYPGILDAPTAEILTAYREHEGNIRFWFAVLCLSAALLAPIGLLLGRMGAGVTVGRWIAGLGIAAAVVKVIGLARWVVLIPQVSHDALDPTRTAAAHDRFERLHVWLGEVIGETAGYALSATFTILVAITVTRRVAPRWMSVAGCASAVLIATGVLIPLGLSTASVTNFIGYVVWTLWLVAMAVFLWRHDALPPRRAAGWAPRSAQPRAVRSTGAPHLGARAGRGHP